MTRALSSEFGSFDGRLWLNCAHQGPLPRCARKAALEAIRMKQSPARLNDDLFRAVPQRLRQLLARLVGGAPDEIALSNSTSYGFNVLAHGLPWRDGDEILCVDGDFPASVVPWLPLRRRGVRLRLLELERARLDPDRLASELGPRTRAVCVSWVFSFFGHAIDLAALGACCRERGVYLFVNGSQAVGARELDLSRLQVDALSACGFKWLCGPYATGFVWFSQHLLDLLDFPQPHWLRLQQTEVAQAGVALDRRPEYTFPNDPTAAAYDVFCAANFLNFMPWTASLEHLLDLGISRIERHDQTLVERLVCNLPAAYELESPREQPERSTLVLCSHRECDRNSTIAAYLREAGIDVALRNDRIRISPHLYNSDTEIDKTLEMLQHAA